MPFVHPEISQGDAPEQLAQKKHSYTEIMYPNYFMDPSITPTQDTIIRELLVRHFGMRYNALPDQPQATAPPLHSSPTHLCLEGSELNVHDIGISGLVSAEMKSVKLQTVIDVIVRAPHLSELELHFVHEGMLGPPYMTVAAYQLHRLIFMGDIKELDIFFTRVTAPALRELIIYVELDDSPLVFPPQSLIKSFRSIQFSLTKFVYHLPMSNIEEDEFLNMFECVPSLEELQILRIDDGNDYDPESLLLRLAETRLSPYNSVNGRDPFLPQLKSLKLHYTVYFEEGYGGHIPWSAMPSIFTLPGEEQRFGKTRPLTDLKVILEITGIKATNPHSLLFMERDATVRLQVAREEGMSINLGFIRCHEKDSVMQICDSDDVQLDLLDLSVNYHRLFDDPKYELIRF